MQTIKHAKARLKTDRRAKLSGQYFQCRTGGMGAVNQKK